MPFGKKHKGKRLLDVPLSYFRWMWEECTDQQKLNDPALWNYIALAIKEEMPAGHAEPKQLKAGLPYKDDDDEPNPFYENP